MYTYNINERLKNVIENTISKMKGIGINVCPNIAFKESGGITRAGYCTRKKRNGVYVEEFTISINRYIINEKDELSTVIHELIHTVPGCFNHGELWKKYAKQCSLHFEVNVTVREEFELSKEAVGGNVIVCDITYYNPLTMNIAACPSCGKRLCISKKIVPKKDGRYSYLCKKCNRNFVLVNEEK